MATSFDNTSLESLEVGAAPVVRRFLDRLQLAPLLARYLPPTNRRREDIPTSVTLCVLVTNLLLAREVQELSSESILLPLFFSQDSHPARAEVYRN